jgi:hypothetical protein
VPSLTPGTLGVNVINGNPNGGAATGITLIVGGTTYVNTCILLTIETINSSGQITPVTATTVIQLTGSGVSFFSNSTCTQSLAPANQTTIAAGSSSTTVWFEGSNPGTVTITATTVPAGALAQAYVNFYLNGSGGTVTTSVPVIYDILLSQIGLHIVGGPAGAAGYTCQETFEDCGGNSCSGQQTMCAIASTNISSAITDLWITANGTHTPSAWCPTGYTMIGEVVDCYNGQCGGVQSFCKQTTTSPHQVSGLEGLSVTSLNAHTGQQACPAGWNLVGTVEDCGNMYCSGLQTICDRKAWLP